MECSNVNTSIFVILTKIIKASSKPRIAYISKAENTSVLLTILPMELWILKYFSHHGGKTIIVLLIINSNSTRKELTIESRTDGSLN